MWMGLLFLISSVILARFFEKHKMKVASITYAILFTCILFFFIFTFAFGPIKDQFVSMFGEILYAEIVNALLCESEIVTFLGFFLAVQIAISILSTSTAIVNKLKKRDTVSRSSANRFFGTVKAHAIYHNANFNRLYCRMLN